MVRRKGEQARVEQKGYGTVLLAMIVHDLCRSSQTTRASPVEQDHSTHRIKTMKLEILSYVKEKDIL